MLNDGYSLPRKAGALDFLIESTCTKLNGERHQDRLTETKRYATLSVLHSTPAITFYAIIAYCRCILLLMLFYARHSYC